MFDNDLTARLRRYARSDARRSDASAASTPHELRALLVDDLASIGVRDVRLTAGGAVLATIPATVTDRVPTIAFLVPLLGPDDNAGAAITMALAGYLVDHPDLRHGRIRIGFASDEDIGCGMHRHLPDELDAAVIYSFKTDERPSHEPRSSAQTADTHGADGWKQVEKAARAAAMCVDAVRLVD